VSSWRTTVAEITLLGEVRILKKHSETTLVFSGCSLPSGMKIKFGDAKEFWFAHRKQMACPYMDNKEIFYVLQVELMSHEQRISQQVHLLRIPQ